MKNFKEFHSNMLKHKSTTDFKKGDKEKYIKLAEDNPVKFLARTHEKFFYRNEEDFCLAEGLLTFKIIKADGKKYDIRVADKKEHYDLLETKLEEEVNEFLQDKNLDELADIMEVLYGLSEN